MCRPMVVAVLSALLPSTACARPAPQIQASNPDPLRAAVARYEERIRRLEHALTGTEKAGIRRRQADRARAKADKAAAGKQADAIRQRLAASEKEVEALRRAAAVAGREQAALHRALSRAKKNTEKLTEDYRHGAEAIRIEREGEKRRFDQLGDALARSETQRDAATKKNEATREQVEDLRNAIATSQRQKMELQRSLDSAKAQRQELEGSRDRFRAELARAKSDLATTVKKHEMVEQQVEELRGAVAHGEARNTDLQHSLEKAKARRRDLEGTRDRFRAELAGAKSELATAGERIDNLKRQQAKAADEARRQVAEMERHAAASQSEHEDVLRNLVAASTRLQTHLTQAKLELELAAKQQADTERALAEGREWAARVDELEAALGEAEARRAAAERSQRDQSAQIANLANQLHQMQARNAALASKPGRVTVPVGFGGIEIHNGAGGTIIIQPQGGRTTRPGLRSPKTGSGLRRKVPTAQPPNGAPIDKSVKPRRRINI